MKFEFVVHTGKRQAPPTHDAVIAPLAAWKKTLAAILGLASVPAAAQAQWEKSQKKMTSENDKDTFRSVRIGLADGQAVQLFFVSDDLSTYELHTELRKQFSAFFSAAKDAEEAILNVQHLNEKTQTRVLTAMAALSVMAHWEPTKFGKAGAKQKERSKKNSEAILIHTFTSLPDSKADFCIHQGQSLGNANNTVRTLADLPANELNPATYRKHAQDFAKEHGLRFEFLDISKLTAMKAGAFLAVNRADPESKAGIAIIKYQPKKASKKTPVVALVGKGLCFDTGGYNIKTGSYMYGMHGDMTGSALALALCGYFAQIEAPFEVHAYLSLAENLISPTAYKPNEVVIAMDGTSIEVIDTDAEGRMVLADTLALVRKHQPTLCIDYATLTGAAIRSLDTRRGAVFSNREHLAQAAVEAGKTSGERTWSFPIGEDYAEMLKSKVADLQQCASGSNSDHIYAATFLSHFIGNDTPWVHLDLTPAENKGGLGLASTDTTGFGIFWSQQFVEAALQGEQK